MGEIGQAGRGGRVKVLMFPLDHNPPHFHGRLANGSMVQVAIDTGDLMAGTWPPAQLGELEEWRASRVQQLRDAWAIAVAGEIPPVIP